MPPTRPRPNAITPRVARGLLAFALSLNASGQTPAPATLITQTNLVVIPAVVRSSTGSLLHGLTAQDFRLLDNGQPQQLHLDEVERQPIALVVLLQTGASATRHFTDYAGIPTLLEALVANVPHQIAVVTFDSQPEEEWAFTGDLSTLRDAFTKPTPGDDKAALLDAVAHGIELLEAQPPSTRRILLLISQQQDAGSEAHAQQIIEKLGANNIAVESLSFSPEKTLLHDQFTQPRHGNPPYQLSPLGPPVLGTFNLDVPLLMAIGAMRSKTTTELATLSGGESLPFSTRHGLEDQLATLTNHLANRYTLSFRPSSNSPGFHTLQLSLPQQSAATINARTSYWSSAQPH